MPLPWSRSVCLRVAPDAVCATLAQGWPHAKVVARANHSVDGPFPTTARAAQSPSVGANDALSSALDAVLLKLAESRPLRGARLDIELADALVHLDTVAGEFIGNGERQLQSIAAACVTELLGDAAPDHDIRWQLQSGGKHLLIGAMARSHIQAFTEAARRHRLRLRSVQPDFCLQWNRHAASLKPGSAVFAVASGSDAVVAHVMQGAVTAVSSGCWLDRDSNVGASRLHVKRLMCGLGLDPAATAGALDIRVGRLLASVGQDEAAQSGFVLVAPQTSEHALSSRWTVINRAEQTAP